MKDLERSGRIWEVVICIVCVDLIKQQMTMFEAEKNLGEMVTNTRETPEKTSHYRRLKYAIEQLELDEIGEILDEPV